MQVIRHDAKLHGHFAYDLFGNQIMISKPLPWDRDQNHEHYPRPFADEDVTHLAQYAMGSYRLNVGSIMIYETLRAIAKENGYHPVQEYFLGLKWDGVPRIDTWLRDYVDAEDTEVSRKISAWWLMSAFMRIADPGCQADYCLILEGLTGRGKSQAFKALAGCAWFSDSVSAFTSKDAAIDISGKWIIELAELSNFHSAKDVNVIKSFVTRTTDRHRPPYGKVAVDLPRGCVFAGTTNDAEYLQDTTGNRRFWPVTVGNRDIDIAAISAIRDQLWAEAAVRVARGERYWPKDEAERELFEKEVDKRRVVDSAEDKVWDWLDNPIGYRGQNLTSAWILENVLGIQNAKRSDDTRLNAILRKVGFTRQLGAGSRYWNPPSGWAAPNTSVAQLFAIPNATNQGKIACTTP
jgi:predicted P-loop ATPase